MKARLIQLLLLLSLCASIPASAQILFDPPAPDTRSWVTAQVFGTWCSVRDPEVTVTGSHIEIMVPTAGGVCITFPAPVVYAQLGTLPPGVYDVTVRGAARPASGRLIVRDARKIQVTPRGAPTTGGIDVEISAVTGNAITVSTATYGRLKVQFGDGPLQQPTFVADAIVVKVPPHDAGTVDVKVIEEVGGVQNVVVLARAAFTYYDEAQPPELSVFEPLLFPITYDGPGAFGSQWTTENWISASDFARTTYFHRPVCSGCPNALSGRVRIPPSQSPEGLVLWPARGTVPRLGASSRARDLSRQGENAGVSVPLAREADFAFDHQLPDVPTGGNYRATLRLWTLDLPAARIPRSNSPWIRVEAPGAYRDVTLQESAFGFSFASLDVTDLLRGAGSGSVEMRTRGGGSRHWGILSVTNNETQQVTIIAPLRKSDASVVPRR